MNKEKKNSRKLKKEKKKANESSDSESGDEHELFHFANDRVQLMKQVLKILKSKKIKSLAPDNLKNLDMEEINTMLLEELLGISNKRLKKILQGQNADDESSSSSEDEAAKPIDIISLDDISDDEDFEETPREKSKRDPKNDKSKNTKRKKGTKVKVESASVNEKIESLENEKLLSVLEVLELQARARAIRSQLALEAEKNRAKEVERKDVESDGEDDAVIVESPKRNEIVISSSSDSENEKCAETKDDKLPEMGKCVEGEGEKGSEKQGDVERVSEREKCGEVGKVSETEKCSEVEKVSETEMCSEVEKATEKSSKKIKLIRNLVIEAVDKIPLPEENVDKAVAKGDSESDDVIVLDVPEIDGIDD